ncbi:BAG domain-containing protein Samui isoform X2 [Drosophila hydei]|uniref:BAG domain-containing protein Samui isoform X2 n=1 Tax=Drosophila hydei TaxID=7224 RepID=A0A6J1MFF2_DROHY|nr:BAG domain-containing protein Samui isoform X2 [Drosophila hydei]
MKPTVIAASQASAASGAGGSTSNSSNGNGNGNVTSAGAGVNIPISREYMGIGGEHNASPQQHHQQHYAQQRLPPQFYNSQTAYGSPRQQQVPPNQQQQHFQPFGFEPDMDMDMENMFGRSRLGRLNNDPFAGFGGTRKRNSLHDPQIPTHPQAHSMHADDDFSHYFDDAADFGFPQFSTLGRRGRVAGGANSNIEPDDDFFHRLPSEFRQYIPEGFSSRRTVGSVPSQQRPQQAPQYYQQEFGVPQQPGPTAQPKGPQSPSKRLCDAAIQTDDPAGRSEVDCAPTVNLNQHGLRNTMDMGVKSIAEQEQGPRSHSAPPPEQQKLNQQYQQHQQQQQQQQHQPQQQTNQRPTPPPQFGTQTSPQVQPNLGTGQPQFHKTYYAPQQQSHPQQKQQTPPPPQTPGGSNVRTIPIFVEGRADPVINAHKEIPTQSDSGVGPAQAQAQAWSQAYASTPANQQHRPAPLNTQQPQGDHQLQTDAGVGMPPQTPHTLDSIKKIQDIQRDVLDLMAKVEQFKGTRQDKEYVYLDEMLTRNLLKLDTIDTNGKDSIRLARKEAIKCIQASVNVLDAKAEENGRRASGIEENAVSAETADSTLPEEAKPSADSEPATPQPLDATKIQDPIPLPPPQSTAEEAADNPTEESQAASNNSMETPKAESTALTTSSE